MSGGLWALFVGSLLASTLLPGGVEGLLYYMVQENQYTFMALLVIASTGNTLGGIITWWIGYLLYKGLSGSRLTDRLEKWFDIDDKSLQRVRHWGAPVLLLSWLPVIGDPLCLAAGYLRLQFWPCVAMIALGKTGRYLALLWLLY
jgi:membrane protein YqaA with SNARE-associated domain